jgi:hypothetical protein
MFLTPVWAMPQKAFSPVLHFVKRTCLFLRTELCDAIERPEFLQAST